MAAEAQTRATTVSRMAWSCRVRSRRMGAGMRRRRGRRLRRFRGWERVGR